jgi:hypothetical protein
MKSETSSGKWAPAWPVHYVITELTVIILLRNGGYAD